MSDSASVVKRRNHCPAQNKLGEPCGAAPTEGGLCYFHANPKKASELGRKGGSSRKRQLPSEASVAPLPALDNMTDGGRLIDCLIDQVHSGQLDLQRAKSIVSLLSLELQLGVSSSDTEDAPPRPRATFFEVFEAAWLRDKKRKWVEEFEKKYADRFPNGDTEEFQV
jgi:hypothetical protein